MAGLGAVVERVTAHFQAAGGFIVDLFSKGPTEAAEAYRAEVDKLPGSMTDAVRATMELQKAEQALLDTRRELTVADAQGRQEIARLRLIARDRTKDTEERIDAAKRAMAIELDLVKQREEAAAEELRIAQERAKMSDTSDEDLQRLADLEANLINIRTQSFMTQRRLQEEVQSVEREATAERKAQANARIKTREAEAKAAADAAAAIIKAEQKVVDELAAARLAREDQRTQEEAAAKKTYEERVQLAGENAELLAQVEEEYRLTLMDIDDKYQAQALAKEQEAINKRAEAEKAATEFLAAQRRTAREQELAELAADYSARIMAVNENAELVAQLEEDYRRKERELQERYYEEDQALARDNNSKKVAQTKESMEAEMSLRAEVASQTFSILTNLNEAFSKKGEQQSKKSFERTKALSIAETLVSTYLAAQAAFASQFKPLATVDSPIRGALAAGAAVAGGLARVAAIKSQQYNGGGGAGGGGAASAGGFSGGTQSVGVDVGSLIPNQQTPTPEPVRAYVVENEISNKQALNRELQIQTTL